MRRMRLAVPPEESERPVLLDPVPQHPQCPTRAGNPMGKMYYADQEPADCLSCGAALPIIRHWRTLFCGRQCANRYFNGLRDAALREARQGRTCALCGTPFEAKRRDRRFCSDRCAGRAWRARKRGGAPNVPSARTTGEHSSTIFLPNSVAAGGIGCDAVGYEAQESPINKDFLE